MSTTFDDVALFNTIDKLLKDQAVEAGAERRTAERHQFECIQLLAPYDGERLPLPAEFRQVRCQDLSPGGFSFYCYRRPDTEFVVAALGQIPFMFLAAEIRHVRPLVTHHGHEFFVGCRFIRKLSGAEQQTSN